MKQSTQQILIQFAGRYPVLSCCQNYISAAVDLIIKTYYSGNKIMVCGNGGSAADSQHIVGELMKEFVLPRYALSEKREKIKKASPEKADMLLANLHDAIPALSLVGELSLSTAFANDKSAAFGFAQSVYGLGKSGDALIAISTSGNSENIIYAVQVANALGISVIALTGQSGGLLKKENCSGVTICVPSEITYEVQEYHLPIYHALCLAAENEIFGEQIN